MHLQGLQLLLVVAALALVSAVHHQNDHVEKRSSIRLTEQDALGTTPGPEPNIGVRSQKGNVTHKALIRRAKRGRSTHRSTAVVILESGESVLTEQDALRTTPDPEPDIDGRSRMGNVNHKPLIRRAKRARSTHQASDVVILESGGSVHPAEPEGLDTMPDLGPGVSKSEMGIVTNRTKLHQDDGHGQATDSTSVVVMDSGSIRPITQDALRTTPDPEPDIGSESHKGNMTHKPLIRRAQSARHAHQAAAPTDVMHMDSWRIDAAKQNSLVAARDLEPAIGDKRQKDNMSSSLQRHRDDVPAVPPATASSVRHLDDVTALPPATASTVATVMLITGAAAAAPVAPAPVAVGPAVGPVATAPAAAPAAVGPAAAAPAAGPPVSSNLLLNIFLSLVLVGLICLLVVICMALERHSVKTPARRAGKKVTKEGLEASSGQSSPAKSSCQPAGGSDKGQSSDHEIGESAQSRSRYLDHLARRVSSPRLSPRGISPRSIDTDDSTRSMPLPASRTGKPRLPRGTRASLEVPTPAPLRSTRACIKQLKATTTRMLLPAQEGSSSCQDAS